MDRDIAIGVRSEDMEDATLASSVPDARRIKDAARGKVCLLGNIDTSVLAFGTPAEVRAHVRDVFAHLGTPRGGIIACGEIGPETPLANIKAMYEAFASYSG